LDSITLIQAFEPITLDSGKMDEYVFSAPIGGDESITLLIIEPLHNPLWHSSISFLSCEATGLQNKKPRALFSLRLTNLFICRHLKASHPLTTQEV